MRKISYSLHAMMAFHFILNFGSIRVERNIAVKSIAYTMQEVCPLLQNVRHLS